MKSVLSGSVVCAFVTAAALLVVAPRSAAAEPEQEAQIWTALLSNAKLANGQSGASLWLDVHARRGGANALAIVRPGVGWRFSKHLSLWAGYAWIPTDFDEGPTRQEHRPWQQAIAKTASHGWSFQARTRFEQRLRNDGDDVGLRLRQFLRASQDVGSDSPFGVVVWNETFVGLNEPDWGARKGFDQNRLFVGAAAHIRSNMRLEGGYLALWVARDGDDLLGHVLATNLFVSL